MVSDCIITENSEFEMSHPIASQKQTLLDSLVHKLNFQFWLTGDIFMAKL